MKQFSEDKNILVPTISSISSESSSSSSSSSISSDYLAKSVGKKTPVLPPGDVGTCTTTFKISSGTQSEHVIDTTMITTNKDNTNPIGNTSFNIPWSSESNNPEEGKKEARRKRLLKKAPDAPKRFKSAYICYVIEKMDEVKKTLPDDVKVTEAMKTLAVMWKELPPETKMEYQKRAEDDKSRYFAEMRDYTGPMHVPNKRQKKPAGAPKRAMSAFLSFSQQMRPQVRAKHPDLKNTDISGVLAQLWREGTEEEKAPHINRELREREKYHEDMVKWKEEVSQQAELDALNTAAMNETRAKRAEIEKSRLAAAQSSSGSSDMGFVPSMGNGISSTGTIGNNFVEDDFFNNVWMDNGWAAVDKLIQDAEREDPTILTSNVHQDFLGGQPTGGRYNSRVSFPGAPVDQGYIRQFQSRPYNNQQQQLPRALPPMMPPLQAQASDANSLLKHDASSLLNYTASAYDPTIDNNHSVSKNAGIKTSANAPSFDYRMMPEGQGYVPFNNPLNGRQQQFYRPNEAMQDNRNIFNDLTYNFENFQQQQHILMRQQQQIQQQQQLIQQQLEEQEKLQQNHHQQHR